MAAIVDCRGLARQFGDVVAVDSLSLQVGEGELFGMLGPNGAGKSTVIKMLTTLLPPSAGSASVGGFDIVRQASHVRRVIGYVPQMVSADGTLTGFENLLVFAQLYGLPRGERTRRIDEALAMMGIREARDRLVREYSGGMLRRLEIAQSMLHRPRVLFLDEPTVGLDPIARETVWTHIGSMRKDFGTTIFLTTHYMEEASSLCERVGIMHLGRLVVVGSPRELTASLHTPGATLDDVFTHFAGEGIGEDTESGGGFREASRARRAAGRRG